MLIAELANSGPMPVLAEVMSFAAQRQQLLAHNIANLDTPDFVPLDVSTQAFQRNLAEAVKRRREGAGSAAGVLDVKETRELARDGAGGLVLKPRTPSGNVLFHDRNSRDLERMMQALTENTTVFRAASELMRVNEAMLRTAISQRV
ncbi:MAG: hypothetical protein WC718_00540 [Phycisphaerales bacterium]